MCEKDKQNDFENTEEGPGLYFSTDHLIQMYKAPSSITET